VRLFGFFPCFSLKTALIISVFLPVLFGKCRIISVLALETVGYGVMVDQ
jgi:hypothetical protein